MKITSLPADAKLIDGTLYYYVDPRGSVYSHRKLSASNRTNPNGYKTVELKQHEVRGNSYGYLEVSNIHGKTFRVHRLVAKAFIPNPDDKPEVNHLDKNRANNNLDNLEWTTKLENMAHAKQDGCFKGYHGAGIPQRKLLQLNPDGSIFKEHASLKDAAISLGGSIQNRRVAIHKAISGLRKTYLKYTWHYAE